MAGRKRGPYGVNHRADDDVRAKREARSVRWRANHRRTGHTVADHGRRIEHDGGVTVIVSVHELLFPAQSKIVNVIGVTPGPTGVPAAGVCAQLPTQQLSVTQAKLR